VPAGSGRRARVCFVTPWYGEGVPGAAAAEARRTAVKLAAAGVEVTVLATSLGGPGRAEFAGGQTSEAGVRVVRFAAARPEAGRFEQLQARAQAGTLAGEEEREFIAGLAHSPALLEHLASHPEEGPFFFIPYLCASSLLGPLLHPSRSVLIPCLREEGSARLPAVRRAFESARAIALHAPAERELAAALYEIGRGEALVIGTGVESGWSADGGRFRRGAGIAGPIIVAAAGTEAGENAVLLREYFRQYLKDRAGAGGLRLVLLGGEPGGAGSADEAVLELGAVGEQERRDALAAAALYVEAVPAGSCSVGIMEAWLAGTPVLVHAGCAVARGHVQAAGGGLHFVDYPHFAECLDRLLSGDGLGEALATAKQAYVLAACAWPPVLERYRRLIERIESEAHSSGPPSAEGAPGAAEPRVALARTAPAVHQMLSDFAAGDAIGNEVLAIQKALRSWGVRSEIFASHPQPAVRDRARPAEDYAAQAAPEDVLLFHFSIGHRLADEMPGLPGRKVLRYHNITPAHFLEAAYPDGAERSRLGRRQFQRLAGAVELGLGVSAFNCDELAEAGCAAVEEVPILLDLAVLETPPDPRILARFGDGRPTVLHVGRLVPNKRIEDLVKTHYWLTRAVPRARLLLVGTGESNPYAQGVRRLTYELGVPGVFFTGPVSNAALAAYYRSADVYLCLSEHEGFCVPLVEAMHFGLPIVARAAAAVPGTLGTGGLLLAHPDPVLTSEVLARVLGDEPLRRELGRRARERLEAFRPAVVRERLRQVLCSRLGVALA